MSGANNGMFGRNQTKEARESMSKSKIGKKVKFNKEYMNSLKHRMKFNNPMKDPVVRKKSLSKRHKIYYYKNIAMKSSYEIAFAKWLDFKGLLWEYEPRDFLLIIENREHYYTPDFYVHNWECFVEIKGWFYESSQQKVECFRKTYLEFPLIVFTKECFNMIGVKVV